MLPKLPDTDILQHQPDAEGLFLFAYDFTINQIPRGSGIYCFYEPVSNIPIYIGSGCSTTFGKEMRGLRIRIKDYRRAKEHNHMKSTAAIGEVVKLRRLLLKVWITASSSDARKYEADAINLYKPELNIIGSTKDVAERYKKQLTKSNEAGYNRKVLIVYNPNVSKICTVCGIEKLGSEFTRHARMANGIGTICKKCNAEKQRIRNQLIRDRNAVILV